MPGFIDRMKMSFNILLNRGIDISPNDRISTFGTSSQVTVRDTQSAVLAPIKNRVAMDVANTPIKHVVLDQHGRYKETKHSELNDRLNFSANLDQTGTALIQDAVITLLEEGSCVLVPIETSSNPKDSSSYDILQLRVGRVTEWMNRSVRVEVYNENKGDREEIVLPKTYVAIVYNPLYLVMNEPNSTLKRLINKLSLLDAADKKTHSTGLDLILQLPFSLKREKFWETIQMRRKSLTDQLDSPYGVAFVDATDKIHQLNRPVTNTLSDDVQVLTEQLYNQLGLTPAVFSGTASEEEILDYHNKTVIPILKALTESMSRTFITRTARSQGQSIRAFIDTFKMASIEKIAEAADKFTRNEILSSNELRQILGFAPSDQEGADELRNKNLNRSGENMKKPLLKDKKGGLDDSET